MSAATCRPMPWPGRARPADAPVEEPLTQLRRDARTLVGHGHRDAVAVDVAGDPDRDGVGATVHRGVLEQHVDDLGDVVGAAQRAQPRGLPDDDPAAGQVREDDLTDDVVEVDAAAAGSAPGRRPAAGAAPPRRASSPRARRCGPRPAPSCISRWAEAMPATVASISCSRARSSRMPNSTACSRRWQSSTSASPPRWPGAARRRRCRRAARRRARPMGSATAEPARARRRPSPTSRQPGRDAPAPRASARRAERQDEGSALSSSTRPKECAALSSDPPTGSVDVPEIGRAETPKSSRRPRRTLVPNLGDGN